MSNNMLSVFEWEGKVVRMVGTADAPEWVAADVCDVLGIRDASMAIAKFPDNSKGTTTVGTLGGTQKLLTVTEAGLYRLIFKSRKQEAERFQTLVCSEVLPCIRKHGCYPAPDVAIGENAIVTVNRQFMSELGAVLRESTFGMMEPLNKKVDNCLERMSAVEQVMHDFAPRKPLTEQTRRNHISIVYRYYSGKCPCCCKVLIVGENNNPLPRLQFDHWVRRTQNGLKDTWAVCGDCNSKFNDHDFKAENHVMFAAYQKHRRDLEKHMRGPCIPGLEDDDEATS